VALFVGEACCRLSTHGAPSKIYRYDGGQWKLEAKNSVLLDRLGIVNGRYE